MLSGVCSVRMLSGVCGVRRLSSVARPGVRQVPEGSGEQGQLEKTGCKIICGSPTTLAVKGLMMMMMMMSSVWCKNAP